ncbi:MAG: formyltransferase family protein [Candidatus Hadarchaeales archaeon]
MVKRVIPLHIPVEGKKMRIVVLFSGGASAVPFMVGEKNYEVVGAISSNKNASGIKKLQEMGIPVKVLDIKDFYGSRPISDMLVREEYDGRLVSMIREMGWKPDIIACSGYMYVLTRRFLSEFPNRVLNVHPADLSITRNGRRVYTGMNVVKDQIEAGERFTRSTVHIMNESPDQGPIIVVSDPLPVEGRRPEEQQALMKEKCDGPAYRKALELISSGMVGFDDNNNVYIRRGDRWVMGFWRGAG